MTDDAITAAVDAATELLGESDAMDPSEATMEQSIEYLEGIQSWTRISIRALRHDQAKAGGDGD